MKRNLLLMLLSVITAFGVGVAHSKECKDVNFPEQAQVEGSTLTLNGLGLRQATVLKVNVYVAALYVVKPSTDADAILAANRPKELILHFVRHASSTDLHEAWEEGFANNPKEQVPILKERIEMLKGWMADMKSGQRLTFTHKPGAGIQVDMNGAVKGTIKGDGFAKALLSIWLSANPPNPGLKAGLLGGAGG
jgi:hypothetical protein